MNCYRPVPELFWVDQLPKRPLCDVPWFGNSVVLSNGDVNFCCFSDAVAGNVKQASFEQIWNGPVMQRIRSELIAQHLPVKCRTAACPIHRGDTSDLIHLRMEGALARLLGIPDPAAVRERLCDVELQAFVQRRGKETVLRLSLAYSYSGGPLTADLFAGIRCADGLVRFLPNQEEFPVPFACALPLLEHGESSWELPLSFEAASGGSEYALCIALFEKDSNPNLPSNCYWGDCRTVPAGAAD
jgi:hypothetical protein